MSMVIMGVLIIAAAIAEELYVRKTNNGKVKGGNLL